MKKPHSGIISSRNGNEIGWERGKKILVPNFVHSRLGEENSENNRKKFKKLKNLFPSLFFAKTGWDKPRKKEKKTLVPNSVHNRPWEENWEKNNKKIQKIKKKTHSGIISSQNGMR